MDTTLLEKVPFFLACKESRVESSTSLYSSFSLGPFHSRQSLTIANALRRTLLSELVGTAIISVQIEGVLHEYSMLKGVRESVLDIILNLKEVVLKVQFNSRETGLASLGTDKEKKFSKFTFQKPQIGYLKARGPGIVRARDLKLPSSIQCVNPNQYLFTLCDDGMIHLKVQIYQGKNSILGNSSVGLKKRALDKPFQSSQSFLTYPRVSDLYPCFALSKRSVPLDSSFMTVRSNPVSISKELQTYPLFFPSLTQKTRKERGKKKEKPFTSGLIVQRKQEKRVRNKQGDSKQSDTFTEYLWDMSEKRPNIKFSKKKELQNQHNIIAIDSIFSPINQVNYIIEEKTSSNHIILLEIWTNGSIYPKAALFYAIHELIKLFSRLEMFKLLDTTLLEKISTANQFDKKTNLGSNYGTLNKNMTLKIISANFSRLLKSTSKARKIPANFVLHSIFSNPLLSWRQFSRFVTNPSFSTPVCVENRVDQNIHKGNKKETKKMLVNPISPVQKMKTKNIEMSQKKEIDGNIRSLNSISELCSKQRVTELQRRYKSKKTLKTLPELQLKDSFFLDIGTLDMSLRAYTCLKRASICTIEELLKYTAQDLLSLKNFGKRSLEEVEKSLEKLQFSLKK